MAAATSIISAGAVSKVLANLPPGVTPLYFLPGASGGGNISDGLAGAEPVGYELNGVVYSKYEFMVQISASLTLLLGLVQLVMGIHSFITFLLLL